MSIRPPASTPHPFAPASTGVLPPPHARLDEVKILLQPLQAGTDKATAARRLREVGNLCTHAGLHGFAANAGELERGLADSTDLTGINNFFVRVLSDEATPNRMAGFLA